MFLGELCLANGLGGIAQQFVHYTHPIAIILLLLVVVVAKCSARITYTFRRHCILQYFAYFSYCSTNHCHPLYGNY